MLPINQPLLNSSQVRNVPSVITVGLVQQSVSRGVHRNFVRIRSFVTGSSFSQRVKIIYPLGNKIKHFKFHHPSLFFFWSTYRKRTTLSQTHLQPHLLLLLTLVSAFFGNTNAIYFGVDCQQFLPPQKKCYPKSAQLEECTAVASPGAERCSGTSHRYTHTSCEEGLADQALAFNVPFKGLD